MHAKKFIIMKTILLGLHTKFTSFISTKKNTLFLKINILIQTCCCFFFDHKIDKILKTILPHFGNLCFFPNWKERIFDNRYLITLRIFCYNYKLKNNSRAIVVGLLFLMLLLFIQVVVVIYLSFYCILPSIMAVVEVWKIMKRNLFILNLISKIQLKIWKNIQNLNLFNSLLGLQLATFTISEKMNQWIQWMQKRYRMVN